MSELVRLHPESVEAIARRLAELLEDGPAEPAVGELVDAAAVARRFGLHRSTVYERADEFGAIRIGAGKAASAVRPRPSRAGLQRSSLAA